MNLSFAKTWSSAILKRSQARLKIKQRDRLFWIWLSRTWSGWREALLIVKPTTVIGWHRRGFRLSLDETIAPSGWWSTSGVPTGPGLDPADGDCQSVVWSAKNGLLDNLTTITAAIRKAGIEVFIVPHRRSEPDDLVKPLLHNRDAGKRIGD